MPNRSFHGLRCGLAGLALLTALMAPAAAETPAEILRLRLEAEAPRIEGRALDRWPLAEIYRERAFAPLWLGADRGEERARQLAAALRAAAREGLEPGDYAVDAITVRAASEDPRRQAELDLLITSELLGYLSDLRHGRPAARAADPELHLPRGRLDIASELAAAEAAFDLAGHLAERAPSRPAYRDLRRHLADLRGRAATRPVPGGKPLEEGATGRRVARLQERLRASGDLAVAPRQPAELDFDLVDAVRRFQLRHDLEPDGVAGPATLRRLNRETEARIQQVVINMERLRWLPETVDSRAILVNLAGFRLEVQESGRPVMAMPVIVGRRYRQSPAFAGSMTYLELNPTWTVPKSIAVRDYLPKLRRDPDALAEKDFRILRGGRAVESREVDWSRVSAERFPYVLQQNPGPSNALGRIKFMFPNRFAVYLHDSPADELFSRRIRTFSSGCVRVARPMELAAYLLRDDPDWDRWRLEDMIATGETTQVGLPEAVPVYITYATVWVGDDGAAQYRRDIYGRDARLGRALFGRGYRAES